MRKIRALLAGIVLAALVAGPAFAGTATTSTTVSGTVNSSISVQDIPSTYALGAGLGGTVLTGPTFSPTIVSSEPVWQMFAKSADFKTTAPIYTIPATNLSFNVNGTDKPVLAADTDVLVHANLAGPSIYLKLAIPSNARAGNYSAVVTWTLSN